MTHFADRLAAAVRAKGNAVCVGLDPRWELLPAEVRNRHGGAGLANVADALRSHVEALREDGQPVPDDKGFLLGRVSVPL